MSSADEAKQKQKNANKGIDGATTAAISAAAVMGTFLIAILIATIVIRRKQKRALKKMTKKEVHEKLEYELTVSKLQDKLLQLEELTPIPYEQLFRLVTRHDSLSQSRLDEWIAEMKANVDCVDANSNSILPTAMVDFEARFVRSELDPAAMDTPPHSRYKNVPTRKCTQVIVTKLSFRTTTNAMLDYYGNRILLGQAPIERKIAEHLEMVIQEKVGVVVWVGPLKDAANGRERIFPYIGLAKDATLSFGRFKVTTVNLIRKIDFSAYTFDLEVKGEEWMNRQLELVHIPDWPVAHLSDQPIAVVNAIRCASEAQARRGSDGTPTMLVHCSNGVQESVAFVVAHIGRQMLSHSGQVNPMGILDYVRRHRSAALSPRIVPVQVINVQMAAIGSVFEMTQSQMTMHGVDD